jgi:hypothetical protein
MELVYRLLAVDLHAEAEISVFIYDSTGLYAALVINPENSLCFFIP